MAGFVCLPSGAFVNMELVARAVFATPAGGCILHLPLGVYTFHDADAEALRRWFEANSEAIITATAPLDSEQGGFDVLLITCLACTQGDKQHGPHHATACPRFAAA